MRRSLAALAALLAVLAVAACGGSAPQSATGSVHPTGWGSAPKGFTTPRILLGVQPTATMYDAVSVGNIPAHPFAAAGYTAGNFVTWPFVRSHAQHAISIAVQAIYHADCLDVEPLDATPPQAGPWAVADIKAGFKRPCLYSDLSEMPAVQASLRASLGASWRGRVFLWLAWYRHVPGLVAGYDAVQYDDHCLGRNLDCSTVTLAFLSIAQPPYKPVAYVACFHRRLTRSACKTLTDRVESDQRAAVSSQRAFTESGCAVLSQRVRWFGSQLRKHPRVRTNARRRALRASQAAYRERGCGVFAQRVRWFDNQVTTLEGA